jgi:hypothetical protein
MTSAEKRSGERYRHGPARISYPRENGSAFLRQTGGGERPAAGFSTRRRVRAEIQARGFGYLASRARRS